MRGPPCGSAWDGTSSGPDTAAAVWHNGGTGGYHSFIGFDPRRKIGVVVLSNSTLSIDDIGFHILNPASALATVRAAVALPADSLDTYIGEYQLAPAFAISIRKVNGSLVRPGHGAERQPDLSLGSR